MQYRFMAFRSFSITFLPRSSCHFFDALVKAFFLDLYLNTQL